MSYREFLKANDTKELLWMRDKWTSDLIGLKKVIENATSQRDRLQENIKLIDKELEGRKEK